MNEIKKIREGMLSQLKDTDWYEHLNWFIKSNDFDSIIEKMFYKSKTLKLRFTPVLRDILNPFLHCEYKNIKLVIISDKPSCEYGYSNGIGIGKTPCSEGDKPIIDPVLADLLYAFYVSSKGRSLSWIAKSGVLFINQSPTVMIDNKDSDHYDIWRSFTFYILDLLNNYNKSLPILVFESNNSSKVINYINKKHSVYEIYKTITRAGKKSYLIKNQLIEILNKHNLNELRDKKNKKTK